MIKKDKLYYPTAAFKKSAWIKDRKIYKTASKDPVAFWENFAKDIFWRKRWKKAFVHNPPYIHWFSGGKMNITESILEKNLEKDRNKPAFIWEPEPIEEQPKIFTYGELYKEVNKFANALKGLGVGAGDRVAIYLPMIPETIISMLACARIGAVHAVVFSAFSALALRVRLQDTEAEVLITADGYYRRGQIVNLKASADEAVKETNVTKMIVVRRARNEVSWSPETDLWYQDLIKGEKDKCKAEIMDAEDPLFILYTSGSTGKPKGIVHACGGYTVQTKYTGKLIFDLHKNDTIWCTSDVGWVTGHTYVIYSPLLNGVTTLIFEGAPDWPMPDRWAQIIEKYKVTIFYTAPTAIRMFEKYGEDLIKKYKFGKLRLLGSVGEPIDETAWLWYFNEIGHGKCPLVDTWWQTETGGILLTSLPGVGPFKPSFTGLPFPGIKAEIYDEQGKACEPNKEGNLVILPPFAPSLLRGVYKNEEKYIKTYWSQYGEAVYFTSDAAFRDESGLIRVVGRVDDVLKVAGHRIATGELESAASKHPDIIESAIIGIADQIKGEVPVIFAVSKSKRPAKDLEKEIVDYIKKEIGPIALPKEVYIVTDLPKTRSGKIMRRILRKLFTGEELGDLSTLSNPEIVETIKKIIADKGAA